MLLHDFYGKMHLLLVFQQFFFIGSHFTKKT